MFLLKLFADLRKCASGNALMIVGLGMPVLIGGAGYGLDVAQWYMWKRELQHAVDQGAYAGAWARARVETEDSYAVRADQEYDGNLSKVREFASDPTIRLVDYGGGTLNSVLVTATATKKLPFSSFLTGEAATIRATAQASFNEGYSHQACLIALTETGTGASVGGSATVQAQCGFAALSCDANAIVIDGSATVITDSIVACGEVTVPPENEGEVTEGVTGLTDIRADLDPPTNDTPRSVNCTGNGRNAQASLLPGTYTGGLRVRCRTVLQPGIYVIDGGELDLTANYDVNGTGVMFVLKNGARMKLGGSGNGNSVTLTPMTAADFVGTDYEAQADRLSDMLVFEHRDNNVGSPGHTLNGNSNSLIEGMIYLPDGDLRINGTANVSAQCLQISAYSIEIGGGANLETFCPPEDTSTAGTSLADVRLIA